LIPSDSPLIKLAISLQGIEVSMVNPGTGLPLCSLGLAGLELTLL
jgi:hypothetical protein